MSPLISGLASVASMIFNASSSNAGKSPAARRPADTAEAGPASVVRLSPEAQALAGAAGKLVSPAAQQASAIATAAAGGAPGAGKGGAVSTQDFQALLTQFGATDAQKEQLIQGLDANQDGSISRDEFLQGLANTRGSKEGSDLSQALMQVMDGAGSSAAMAQAAGQAGGKGDGTVTAKEFAALTTAFAALEKKGMKAA